MEVFAWDQYYPQGGYNDYVGEAANDEELRKLLQGRNFDSYQCVVNGRVISNGYLRDLQK